MSLNQKEIIKIRDLNKLVISTRKNEIIEEYKKNPNLKNISNIFGVSVDALRRFLKKVKIYDPYSKTSLNIRHKKIKNTLNKKYGNSVNNVSKLHVDKLKERNAIPKNDNPFEQDFKNYTWYVNQYTNKSRKKLIDSAYCYYTGIKFSDCFMNNEVNPNDFLKKTIDHKISILFGFLMGIEPEVIGGVSNLVYCIRYCNSIKSNSNSNDADFKKICMQIRRRLINAGYEHTKY